MHWLNLNVGSQALFFLLLTRKRQEAEKSESYETWLAAKETEKKTTHTIVRQAEPIVEQRPTVPKSEGYLRAYLRSLDERRKGAAYFNYEDWLNRKEEQVLGIRRTKTTVA